MRNRTTMSAEYRIEDDPDIGRIDALLPGGHGFSPEQLAELRELDDGIPF